VTNAEVKTLAREYGFTFARRRPNGTTAFTRIEEFERRPEDADLHAKLGAMTAILESKGWRMIRKRHTIVDGETTRVVYTITAIKETDRN
jgi:hypothetical protein